MKNFGAWCSPLHTCRSIGNDPKWHTKERPHFSLLCRGKARSTHDCGTPPPSSIWGCLQGDDFLTLYIMASALETNYPSANIIKICHALHQGGFNRLSAFQEKQNEKLCKLDSGKIDELKRHSSAQANMRGPMHNACAPLLRLAHHKKRLAETP